MKNKSNIVLIGVVVSAMIAVALAFLLLVRTEEVAVGAGGAEKVVTNSCVRAAVRIPATATNASQVVTNRNAVIAKAPTAVTNVVAAVPHRARRAPVTYDPKIPKARQVLLANRRIVVSSERSFPDKFCAAQSPTARGTAPYIVIPELPVNRQVRMQATVDGALVIGYLPKNALLVEADEQALKNLKEDPIFLAAVEYEPMDKIQSGLTSVGGTVRANIHVVNAVDVAALKQAVAEGGGRLLEGVPTNGRSFAAEITTTSAVELAKRGEVKWISKVEEMKLKNDYSVLPGAMNVTPVWNLHGLDGDGETVASADSGIDTGNLNTLHSDFSNRIVKIVNVGGYTTADYSGHGTHTAGSIMGSGERSGGLYRGVAYAAKLYVQTCGDKSGSSSIYFNYVDTFAELFAPETSRYGNYIHSDSWGSDDYGTYGGFSQGLDGVAWNYPELLVVVANGNAGYDGAMSVGSPATAKNCLSVGNTYSARSGYDPTRISPSSSRGPCQDGRIKPDIAAPGTYIVSTRSSKSSTSKFDTGGYYTKMSGTSMATPHVAGAAALVRQWLRRDRGFDNAENKPTGALLKAILTGGASGGVQPDNDFGWGRVDLEATIFPTNGCAVYLKDRLPFAPVTNLVFTLTTTNVAPLDIQLVWTDYPADEAAAATLVNDLDLRVTAVTNGVKTSWWGNGGDQADTVNNLESVRIREAAVATYEISVECPLVPYDFSEGGAAAIYIRGAFDQAAVNYTESQLEATVLTVTTDSAHAGSMRPLAGDNYVKLGEPITISADDYYEYDAYGNVWARYRCLGWEGGSGDIPETGNTNVCTVTFTRPSAIRWVWAEVAEFPVYRECDIFWGSGSSGYMSVGSVSEWIVSNVVYKMSVPQSDPCGSEHYAQWGSWYHLGGIYLEAATTYGYLFDAVGHMATEYEITVDCPCKLYFEHYGDFLYVDANYRMPYWWFMRNLCKWVYDHDISTANEVLYGDADGDKSFNINEYTRGTDPLDPNSVITYPTIFYVK